MRARNRQIAVGAVVALAFSGLTVLSAPTASAEPCGGLRPGGGSSPLFGSSGSAGGSGKNPVGPQGPLPVISGNAQSVAWVTGPVSPNDTYNRYAISGTDLGISWDNAAGQTLMAFGDTFGNCASSDAQWRSNVLMRSNDSNLADGITVSDVVQTDGPNYASQVIPSLKLPLVEDTTIPTAAISIGDKQYVNYMSVRSWGDPGRWITNFSAVAVSGDNGQTWQIDQGSIRANTDITVPGFENAHAGQGKFQQNAYALSKDGDYLYQFGTPNGRFGDAFVARVKPADILDLTKYEYSTKDPANQWSRNIGDTYPIVRGPVSELSVSWNDYLGQYVMLYGNESTRTIVARTAEKPEGPWSEPTTLLDARATTGGVYAPFIHPKSSGKDLYFTASRWTDYNVLLLHTDLDVLKR